VLKKIADLTGGTANGVLEALMVRSRDRIEAKGANVPAEAEAARVAFDAVAAWAQGQIAKWSEKLLDVSPEVEVAATARFDRALASGPAALRRVLEAVPAAAEGMRRATIRLAEDKAAEAATLPEQRQMLAAFVDAVRPPEVTLAHELAASAPKYRADAVAISRYIVEGVGPRAPEAA
jgi:hypothetical protein